MPNNYKRYKKWTLLPPSSSFEKHFKIYHHHTKYIIEFETDVTRDPFYHPSGRISIIQSQKGRYLRGSYRWKKSDLRICYYPNKDDHTIYPFEASTASNVGYKKRS